MGIILGGRSYAYIEPVLIRKDRYHIVMFSFFVCRSLGEEGRGEELCALHADALRALHGADTAHHGRGRGRRAPGRPDSHHHQGA